MTRYFRLNRKIKDTEQQIGKRQRTINVRSKALAGELQQAMILTPAHLLLASGIGFILGELTRCRSVEATDDTQTGEISPLKVAFNLLSTAKTLYAALPLLLVISSRYSSSRDEQRQTTKEKYHERPH
jgi:hypothetical protein